MMKNLESFISKFCRTVCWSS